MAKRVLAVVGAIAIVLAATALRSAWTDEEGAEAGPRDGARTVACEPRRGDDHGPGRLQRRRRGRPLGTDLTTLRRIAEASQAAVYDSSDPRRITKVFVAVVSNV